MTPLTIFGLWHAYGTLIPTFDAQTQMDLTHHGNFFCEFPNCNPSEFCGRTNH